MKKTVFFLLLGILSIPCYSQKGDLTLGAKGGYINSNVDLKYQSVLYGIDVAYHLSYPLEIAFTGLMNPNIRRDESKLSAYSANIDLRLYLLRQQEWATGPALGGQYYIVDDKTENLGAYKDFGFNIGWHFRINLTDYTKINGGWRYTNIKTKDSKSYFGETKFDMSHHLFYLGVAYTFELR